MSSFPSNTYTAGTRMDSGRKRCGVHEVTTRKARMSPLAPFKEPLGLRRGGLGTLVGRRAGVLAVRRGQVLFVDGESWISASDMIHRMPSSRSGGRLRVYTRGP